MAEPHNAKGSHGDGAKSAEKFERARLSDKHVAVPATPEAIRGYLGITRGTTDRVTQLLTQTGVFHVK